MATDYLQALNVGSGIDTKAMVTAIVNAERSPKQNSIDRKTEDVEAKISGMAQLKSSLSTLKTAFEALDDKNDFNFTALSNSQPTEVYAEFTGAMVTPGTYKVSVSQLAQNEIRQTNAFNTQTGDLNNNTATSVTIKVGTGTTHTLDFAAGQATLDNLVSKINGLNIGVSASVVPVGDGTFRVLVQGEYGASKSLTISDGNQVFGMDLGTNMLQVAQNANLKVNGLSVQRSTNEVTDIIPGIKLDLMKQTSGDVVLSLNRDINGAQSAISTLVDAYNSFEGTLRDLVTAENADGEVGALKSDSQVKAIRDKVKELFIGNSSSVGTTIKNLSDMGVSVQRDGSFKVDDTKLGAALVANYDDITKVFSGNTNNQSLYDTSTPRGIAGDIVKQIDTYLSFGGVIESRNATYSAAQLKLEDDQKELDEKMEAVELRYTQKFSTMNKIMDEMKAMQEYLEGQLENLPFNNKD